MSVPLLPIRHGPHRIAAIALYRALLTQCRVIELSELQRNELRNIVQNRFKQARHAANGPRLKISFQAGYEAIDQLDAAAAGQARSLSYVADLIERAPAKVKLPQASQLTSVETSRSPASPSSTANASAPQGKHSILDRPRPLEQLSGKRHVPVLFNANQIPVLRVQKPQPESLTRFLRQRIEQRDKRHIRRWQLYSDRAIAELEDEWDGIVQANDLTPQIGYSVNAANDQVNPTVSKEPSWSKIVKDAIAEVQKGLSEEKRKNREMGEKMQGVVDRERGMFEKERAERKQLLRRAYRQRKRDRVKGDKSYDVEQREDANEPAAHQNGSI